MGEYQGKGTGETLRLMDSLETNDPLKPQHLFNTRLSPKSVLYSQN